MRHVIEAEFKEIPREKIGRNGDHDAPFTALPDICADLLDTAQPGAGAEHIRDSLPREVPPQFVNGGYEAPGVDLTCREPCFRLSYRPLIHDVGLSGSRLRPVPVRHPSMSSGLYWILFRPVLMTCSRWGGR
jgi:hypothetical protein